MSEDSAGRPAGRRAFAGPRWLVILTGAFALGLCALVVVASLGDPRTIQEIVLLVPGGDKTLHFVLMGTMALLLNLALGVPRVRLGPVPLLLGSLVVAGLVTLEEISQLYLPQRAFSYEDLAYDYLGIAVLGQMAVAIEAWQLRRHASRAIERV